MCHGAKITPLPTSGLTMLQGCDYQRAGDSMGRTYTIKRRERWIRPRTRAAGGGMVKSAKPWVVDREVDDLAEAFAICDRLTDLHREYAVFRGDQKIARRT